MYGAHVSLNQLYSFVHLALIYRPFRTACLIGSTNLAIINKDNHVEEELGKENTPLVIVYREKTSKVIKTMLEDVRKPGDESHSGGYYSRSAARRLLGMDESDEAFLRVLEAKPMLSVGDFMEGEGHVGLLRFSFNLNPAMVATVSAWTRSEYS